MLSDFRPVDAIYEVKAKKVYVLIQEFSFTIALYPRYKISQIR